MRRDLEANQIFLRMAERELGLLDSHDPAARRDFEEMHEFYRYRDEELSAVLEGWQGKRESRDA